MAIYGLQNTFKPGVTKDDEFATPIMEGDSNLDILEKLKELGVGLEDEIETSPLLAGAKNPIIRDANAPSGLPKYSEADMAVEDYTDQGMSSFDFNQVPREDRSEVKSLLRKKYPDIYNEMFPSRQKTSKQRPRRRESVNRFPLQPLRGGRFRGPSSIEVEEKLPSYQKEPSAIDKLLEGLKGAGESVSDAASEVGKRSIDALGFSGGTAGKEYNYPGLYRWGEALGSGLAALGDAMVGAGGGKTGFLSSTLKAREAARQAPLKKLQAFQKMLDTEVRAQQAKADRDFLKEKERPGILAKQRRNLELQNNTQIARDLWADLKTADWLSPKMKKYFQQPYNGMSYDMIEKFAKIRPYDRRKKDPKQSIVSKSLASGSGVNDQLEMVMKFGSLTREQVSNLSDSQLNRLRDGAMKQLKTLKDLDVPKNEMRNLREIGRNLNSFLQVLAEGTQQGTLRWEDLEFQDSGIPGRDKVFVRGRDGKLTEIDPPEIKIFGLEGVSGTIGDLAQGLLNKIKKGGDPPKGKELQAIYERIFMPIKNQNFGASQAAKELESFVKGMNMSATDPEALMIKNIQGLALAYGRFLRKSEETIQGNILGDFYLEKRRLMSPEDVSGGVVTISPREAAKRIVDGQKRRQTPQFAYKFRDIIQDYNKKSDTQIVYSTKTGKVVRLKLTDPKYRDGKKRGFLKDPKQFGAKALPLLLDRLNGVNKRLNFMNKRDVFNALDQLGR